MSLTCMCSDPECRLTGCKIVRNMQKKWDSGMPNVAKQGWECPRCHRINAPTSPACDCHDKRGAVS